MINIFIVIAFNIFSIYCAIITINNTFYVNKVDNKYCKFKSYNIFYRYLFIYLSSTSSTCSFIFVYIYVIILNIFDVFGNR